MVLALAAPRRLASRLNRRQEQGHKNSNDRNDDQQFHQAETAPSLRIVRNRAGKVVHVRALLVPSVDRQRLTRAAIIGKRCAEGVHRQGSAILPAILALSRTATHKLRSAHVATSDDDGGLIDK